METATFLDIPDTFANDTNWPQPIALPQGIQQLPPASTPLYTLYRLARLTRPNRALEIGSRTGASAVALALAQKENGTPPDVTAIDAFRSADSNSGPAVLQTWYGTVTASGYFNSGIRLLVGTADKFLPAVADRTYDLVIISGEQEYSALRWQIQEALRLTRAGAYVWVQDYALHDSVQRAVNEPCSEYGLPFLSNSVQRNERGEISGWCLLRNIPASIYSRAGGPPYRLHIGCGQENLPGYINIDFDRNAKADMFLNYTQIGELFPEQSCCEMLLIHSLNYTTIWEARDFFNTAFRLLVPGGKLILETARLEVLVEKILKNIGNFPDYLEGVRAIHGFGLDHLERKERYLPNVFSWSSWHLEAELRGAGFQDVKILPPQTHSPWRDMRAEATRTA